MFGRRGARVMPCEISRTGAKRRGGGNFPAAAPEGKIGFYGFQTQNAAAEMTWPPQRDSVD